MIVDIEEDEIEITGFKFKDWEGDDTILVKEGNWFILKYPEYTDVELSFNREDLTKLKTAIEKVLKL